MDLLTGNRVAPSFPHDSKPTSSAIRVQFGYSITSGCRCRPGSGSEHDTSQVYFLFIPYKQNKQKVQAESINEVFANCITTLHKLHKPIVTTGFHKGGAPWNPPPSPPAKVPPSTPPPPPPRILNC